MKVKEESEKTGLNLNIQITKIMASSPISSVKFSCSVVSDSWKLHGLQPARIPYLSPTPGACSNSCSSSWWCHPTISFSVFPISSCLQSFPASGSFPMCQFFTSGGQILELQLQHQSFQWIFRSDFLKDWLVWSPCSLKGSQESFPIPQFKNISSSALSFLYVPILTSIHESTELNMPANLENSAAATRLEKVSFHSNPNERQWQRMLKLPHNCTHLTR